MHIHKTSRLAAAIALVTALSACGAGGNGDGNNGGNNGGGGNNISPNEACLEIDGRPNQGVIDALQGVGCDLTDGTVISPINNIIYN
ncbi:MAG: hypothetical protein Q7I91_01820, partial [Moraxellaceae bacterium]|nr:hypothetical protein [Moraxellaceae bacterium]